MKITPISLKHKYLKPIWDSIGWLPHHGINVPLLSIWTKSSSGHGDFLDLIPLIDWVSSTGFDIIQLLPLNDSGLDPSPYNPQSSLALNPVYLNWKDFRRSVW